VVHSDELMSLTRRESGRLLQPQLETLRRERISSGARPLHQLSVEEARLAEAETMRTGALEPVDRVVDRAIPGPAGRLEIRLYLPAPGDPPPVLMYFFGGGWVMGSLDASEPVCRRLALGTPCAVVAVGYRLAPEHPFPAAVEDCYAATSWVAAHAAELGLDATRVAVGGGSAGANLAVAVTRLTLERGGPPLVFQLLVYPPTDYRADTPSLRENDDPVFFNRESVAWCWSHYLVREADGDDPLASPLRATDVHGLPSALVITAELDPLRDEGELYAEKLSAAGVPTELVRYDGMVHGFFSMTGELDEAAEAQALAAAALARAFAT
jgi:acetyl esterase